MAQGPRLARAEKYGSRIVEWTVADASHPTSGRRRQTKSPPSMRQAPALPDLIARQRLHTSSDDLAEERVTENEPKRLIHFV